MMAEANEGRGKEAAFLTHTATTMLRWRFTTPMVEGDRIFQGPLWLEADKKLCLLSDAVDKACEAASKECSGAKDEKLRRQLAAAIRRVLKTLPGFYTWPKPLPEQDPELMQGLPPAKVLLDEFLRHHEQANPELFRKASQLAEQDETNAVYTDAVGQIIAADESARQGYVPPETATHLMRMAAGFLKTACEHKPEEVTAGAKKRLMKIADSLAEDTAA